MAVFLNKHLKTMILCAGVIGLIACSGTHSASNLQTSETGALKLSEMIPYWDSFGRIPVTRDDAVYQIRLHNPNLKEYAINQLTLIDDLNKIPASNLTLNSSCDKLIGYGDCNFTLNYTGNTHGAYRLQAELTDAKGKKYNIQQIILTGSEVSNSAVINSEQLITIEPRAGEHYSAAFPVALNGGFTQLKVDNGYLECSSVKACTYFIDGEASQQGDLLRATSIYVYDEKSQLKAVNRSQIKVRQQSAHLLISNPGHQDTANSQNITVAIYNTGNQIAHINKPTLSGEVILENNLCTTTLLPNQECVVQIKLPQNKNDIAVLNIRYGNTAATINDAISTSFSFGINEEVSAKPKFSNIIDFANQIPGNPDSQQEISLMNTGKADFTLTEIEPGQGINFSSALGSKKSCGIGEKLAPNTECFLIIKYVGNTGNKSGVIPFVIKGTYQDKMGQLKSAQAYLPISYSEIILANVLVFSAEKFDFNTNIGAPTKEQIVINNSSLYKAKFIINLPARLPISLENTATNNNCLLIHELNSGASCNLVINHHPTDLTQSGNDIAQINLIELASVSLGSALIKELQINTQVQAELPLQIQIRYTGSGTSERPAIDLTGASGFPLGTPLQHSYNISLPANVARFTITTDEVPLQWGWKFSHNCRNASNACGISYAWTSKNNIGIASFGEDGLNLEYEYTLTSAPSIVKHGKLNGIGSARHDYWLYKTFEYKRGGTSSKPLPTMTDLNAQGGKTYQENFDACGYYSRDPLVLSIERDIGSMLKIETPSGSVTATLNLNSFAQSGACHSIVWNISPQPNLASSSTRLESRRKILANGIDTKMVVLLREITVLDPARRAIELAPPVDVSWGNTGILCSVGTISGTKVAWRKFPLTSEIRQDLQSLPSKWIITQGARSWSGDISFLNGSEQVTSTLDPALYLDVAGINLGHSSTDSCARRIYWKENVQLEGEWNNLDVAAKELIWLGLPKS